MREVKYCRNCGEMLYDRKDVCTGCGFDPMSRQNFCPVCGIETEVGQRMCTSCQTEFNRFKPVQRSIDDAPSFLFALIGFFVPIAGIIIYILISKDQPQKSKSALKGAIIALVLGVVFWIIGMLFALTPMFFLGF